MTSTPIVPQTVLDRYMTEYTTAADRAVVDTAFTEYNSLMAFIRDRLQLAPLKTAIITAGPAGVGKSSLLREINDAYCIDFERALRRFSDVQNIAEYFGHTAAAQEPLRDASKKWINGAKRNADLMLNRLVQEGLPVAFETTGHGAGMSDFLGNLKQNGYSRCLWLADAPKEVRNAALEKHFKDDQEPVYLDPAVNEAKIAGITKNLRVFAENTCEITVFYRDAKDQPLRAIARSYHDGRPVEIIDRASVNAFNANSSLLKGEFEKIEDVLKHHRMIRMRQSQLTRTPDAHDYFGPCRPIVNA